MTEETKKLFNAPWFPFSRACDFHGIKNSKGVDICSDLSLKTDANRLSHLPELYDALIDAAYKTCHDCIYVTLKQGNVPLPNELIKKGCPMKFECSVKKAWEVLKKVRDGNK